MDDDYNIAVFHVGKDLDDHIEFLKREYDEVDTKDADNQKVVAIIPFEQLNTYEDALFLVETLLRTVRHKMMYEREHRFKDTIKNAWMED